MASNRQEAEELLAKYQDAYARITKVPLPRDEPDDAPNPYLDDELLLSRLTARHGLNSREEAERLFDNTTGELDRVRYIGTQVIKPLEPTLAAKLNDLAIGTLPTFELNAQPLRLDGNHKAVILHRGTTLILYHVVCSFLGTISTPQSPPEWDFLDALLWVTQALTTFALGKPYLGYPQVPRFRDPYRMTAFSHLSDNSIAFILGHEFGHVLLGHDEEKRPAADNPSGDALYIPRSPTGRSYFQELEADSVGVELALSSIRQFPGADDQIPYLSVVFFFHILDLLEMFDTGGDRKTHPTARLRRTMFNRKYEQQCDSEMQAEIAAVDKFFDDVRPKLRAAIDQFLQPN